jgi:hypothetical protein
VPGRLTDAQYAALVTAYASGVLQTRTADGWTVTYQSREAMYATIQDEERLRAAAGPGSSNIGYFSFSRGQYPGPPGPGIYDPWFDYR